MYIQFVIIAASHKVYQLKDLQVYSKIWSFNNISIVNFISILSVFMPIKSPRKKSSKSRDPLNVQLVISSHKAPKIELWGSFVFYGHEIGFWTFIQPVFTNIWLFSYFLVQIYRPNKCTLLFFPFPILNTRVFITLYAMESYNICNMSMNCQYKAAHMYIFLLNCYLRCLNRNCTFNGYCTFNGSVPVYSSN